MGPNVGNGSGRMSKKSGVLQHYCLDRWSAAAEQKQVQERAA
jgi:hypothetical protein